MGNFLITLFLKLHELNKEMYSMNLFPIVKRGYLYFFLIYLNINLRSLNIFYPILIHRKKMKKQKHMLQINNRKTLIHFLTNQIYHHPFVHLKATSLHFLNIFLTILLLSLHLSLINKTLLHLDNEYKEHQIDTYNFLY